MVKLLSDMCLTEIQRSLDKVHNVHNLPTRYKEKIIARLSWHDLLLEKYLPAVRDNLFSKSLRHIEFYRCDQVTDYLLSMLHSSGCKLQQICVDSCVNASDHGIQSLTRGQNELEFIKLRKMKHLTDTALDKINSPSLTVLDLKNCTGITFKGVANVTEKNRNLRELHLWGIAEVLLPVSKGWKIQECNEKTHLNIINIASNLGNNLEILDTKLNQMSDECLLALAKYCPNIKQLNIHGSAGITGDALIKLSMGCTGLERLDLSFCSSLSKSPNIEALWTLPTSLVELSLTGLCISDGTILAECLERLRNLRRVKLCGIPVLSDDILSTVLKSIGYYLTSLDLSGYVHSSLTEKGVNAVAEYCYNLEELYISFLHNITLAGLLPLIQDPTRASKLCKLSTSIRQLSEDVVNQITQHCTNLEHLDLAGVQSVDDNTLTTLAQNSTRLKTLGIKGCRQVTDIGVCEVARCCALKSIVLSGVNNLTDRSIFALANSCHYLDSIYLNGCALVSPAAVRYLIDCTIPRLFVCHVTPNASPEQLMALNLDTGKFCRVDLDEQPS